MAYQEGSLTSESSSSVSGDGAGRDPDNVIALGRSLPDEPLPESRPPGRLHRIAISGMAICALLGIAAMLAFITVTWPGDTRRYVIAVFLLSGVGFLSSASIAVFSAARDTYVRPDPPPEDRRTG
jgi:hypothetical protein